MKARSTEIGIWHGDLQGRFTAAAAVPGWMSAWVNLQGGRCLGNGQTLKNRAGVPGPGLLLELSYPWVSLEHQTYCSCGFGTYWGWLCNPTTFAKEMSPALLAAQTELWPTDPTLVHLLHPLQLLLAHLWLLEPDFPWLGVSPTAGLLSAVSHRVQMFLVTPAGLLLNTSLVTLSCNFTVPLLRLKES